MTYLREWITWVLPQQGVLEDIESTDISVTQPWQGVDTYTMPYINVNCAQFDETRETYNSGNYVCTINPVIDVDNEYSQFVWRCGSEVLCNGVAPAAETAWFLTRNKGKIAGFDTADYYEFELDWPYAFGEIVMFLDRMYSCIDNRGNCGFYNPGEEFDTFTFAGY